MRGDAIAAAFAVEIRERYGDVARDRWPVSVDPRPDELLSSWINRLALANGIAPRSFSGVLGCGDGMWSPRLDLQLPGHIAAFLGDRSGVPQDAISAMALTGWALTPLLLPRRENTRRQRSTWMQYCPQCFAQDETPYFRRQWRLASRISCFVHGCGLRDRCPACRSGIVSYDQGQLVPQHFCARCGFDLRGAPKATVKAAVRRLEHVIADIFTVESAKRLAEASDVILRVQRAAAAADIGSARTLANLSTTARIRCFGELAAKPLDWLVTDKDAAVAHRRWMIAAAGGHDRFIACFANFLDKHQARPRSTCPTRPSAELADLLAAYIWGENKNFSRRHA